MPDCLLMDIGGTFVKCGAMADGKLIRYDSFPMPNAGTADEILAPLLAFLRAHPAPKLAVSIPGPMDYRTGESRMKHKFSALYGLPLARLFEENIPGLSCVFVHDGAAFALGEMTCGGLKDTRCGAAVMLGTGLGFVLVKNGRLMMKREALTPARPLWNKPYRDGNAEAYASGTGILRIWRESGHEAAGVREIADAARGGDRDALALFRQVGVDLGQMLKEHLAGEPVERIVLGGQIALSAGLMRGGYESVSDIPLVVSGQITDSALLGAYAYAQKGLALYELTEE